ncbi:MAG TPA: VWA domain-containing protein [Planctomycetota bacterium]|nr:VWA domain-containing protein [Planctomycetota bacterium]
MLRQWFTRVLGLEEVGPVTYFEWFLRHPWPSIVVLLCIVAAVAFAARLYWRERGISRRRRIFLGIFRGILYTILILLLFEPVFGIEMSVKLRQSLLVLLDTSESMGIPDARKKERELEEAAMAMGKLPFEKGSQPMDARTRTEAAAARRIDLAKGILDNPNLDLFQKLEADYKLRYFSFAETVVPASGEGDELAASLRRVGATGKSTRLGTAIDDVVARYSGQPIAGVIALTDGASNEGLEPLEVARKMKDRGIPLFPVGIGVPDPPDVRVEGLVVQDTVFAKDRVPVRFRLTSKGFTNRHLDVVVTVDGKEIARQDVVLTGDTQFEEMSFLPEEGAASLTLKVAATPLPGEVVADNNHLSQNIRVIDEKIKVLYVEGKPRWEYRYLRAVLLRDYRLDVKFLLTQGDRDLPKASDRYLERFPEVAGEAFIWDLVILGDVPASYFTPAQLNRIEQLVRERGGSLLVLPGHQNPLTTYLGSPIEGILPVRLQPESWEAVEETVYPVVTSKGDEMTVVTLEVPEERNTARWARVRPLYQVPAVAGAKPAATVLATLSDFPRRREPYPLICWQRYGRGKAMFVGTDQLWRLRFKLGDRYHARYWGQVIQFLTLSRLLGENKRIQIETGHRSFRTGERVPIYANVLSEAFEPVNLAAYSIYVERPEGQAETSQIKLEPVRDVPGFYQGFFTPEIEGRYVLRASPAEREYANSVELQVATTPLEQLEPALQEDSLRKLAELSGGRYFTIRDLPTLPDQLQQQLETTIVRREKELWDLPFIFIVVLLCAATEWFFRRRYDLI